MEWQEKVIVQNSAIICNCTDYSALHMDACNCVVNFDDY